MDKSSTIITLLAFQIVVMWHFLPNAEENNNWSFWGKQTHQIGNVKVAVLAKDYPRRLDLIVNKLESHIFKIDINNDGKSDFVAYDEKLMKTFFIKSDFSIIDTEDIFYGDGFSYYWFKDIDNDNFDELFSLIGDEDYSDYKIIKFDKNTWKFAKQMKIEPIIISKSKDYKGIYWGYPWDISTLISSNKKDGIFLYCCTSDYQDGPELIKNGVFIAFEGNPTQGDAIGNFTFLTNKLKLQRLSDMKTQFENYSK